MVSYDAAVIQEFADTLYSDAKTIAVRFTLFGFVFGIGIGYAIANGLGIDGTKTGMVVAVAGGVLGYMHGQTKAFALRLQAQQALCQVEVEKNTRLSAPRPPPLS